MTKQKEIEEAVEHVKYLLRITNKDFPYGANNVKQFTTIISLIESYLSIKGFPEEKEYPEGAVGYDCDLTYGYNQALRECKLALLKKMDVIEDVIANTNCHIPEIGRKMKDSFHPSLIENLSQAIKDYLTK